MTNHWVDLKNADVIMMNGSNAAENHPASMTWIHKAMDERGAKLLVVDPRFTRSASQADLYVRIRSGTDIPFFGGLMKYIMELKTHFKTILPDDFVSGSIYYGTMDMTYFSVIPAALKERGLKIAVVFLHESLRFEAWLAGYNKQVQARYWKLIKHSGWGKYRLVASTQGADSIIEYILADPPDFSDLDLLTRRIESGTLEFIGDVERFLAEHER